jgi:hypothetical protein
MSGQVAVTGALFIDCGTGREDPTTGAVRYWKPPRARYECLLCGGREGPVAGSVKVRAFVAECRSDHAARCTAAGARAA